MFFVKINAFQVGLVFKNGELIDVLNKGQHLKPWGAEVQIFDITKPFQAPVHWAIIEQYPPLIEMLEIIEVAENEIVLEYRDNRLHGPLLSGRYAYWKGILNQRFERYDMDEVSLPHKLGKRLRSHPCMTEHIITYIVQNYQKAILYIDDEPVKILESGTYSFWYKRNNNGVKISCVDIRQQQMEINGQELLSKDKAALRININMTFQVVDIEAALVQNKEFERQLYTLVQLALRKFIGAKTLDELLENKEGVSNAVLKDIQPKAEALGVKVHMIGIRDIILPGDVKAIMNQVLVAQKKAQANIIKRREETASTRSLLNTARLMEENEMLFRLKEMEYVETISEKIGEISLSANGGLVSQLKDIFSQKN